MQLPQLCRLFFICEEDLFFNINIQIVKIEFLINLIKYFRFSFLITLCAMSAFVDLSGIFPAITTPFTANGENIDYENLKLMVNTWNKMDFAGYVVMGSTGEAPSLRDSERLQLLREMRKLAKPEHKIIAGLGMPTTSQTIELCNLVAAEKTADAALVLHPYFFKGQMTEEALRLFYREVADSSKLPIILYTVPGYSQMDLSANLIVSLAPHPNIIGVKDSNGDIAKLSELLHRTESMDFQVLNGRDGCLLPGFIMGCVGSVSALPLFLGGEVCKLYQLFKQGRLQEAVAMQKSFVPAIWLLQRYGIPGIKAVMDMKEGHHGGPCRPPMLTLGDEAREENRRVYQNTLQALRRNLQ